MAIDFLTNIEHIVVLMLENRSFDHLCGWFGRGERAGDYAERRVVEAQPGRSDRAVARSRISIASAKSEIPTPIGLASVRSAPAGREAPARATSASCSA